MPEEMVSQEEYKKLQRKYDRRDKTAKESESRIVQLEAAVGRVESFMEQLTSFIAGDDNDLKSHADSMISENKSKRTSDKTAAEFQSRLNQMLDDSDEDWDDPKFNEARRIVNEINASGDMSRVAEAERVMEQVLRPADTQSSQEKIDAAVAAALAAERNSGKRVDTGGSTARQGNVSRNDLSNWNPSEGIGNLKERLSQAMKQISE
jgi:cell fate (sporulation/competence/biofilm development) regulator YlbF (YheA/YmcA/DUF963 family)